MTNKIEVEAECVEVGPVEAFPSGFRKRRVVLKEQGEYDRYPTFLAFVLKKDRADLVNESCVGRRLKVSGVVESTRSENRTTGRVTWYTDFVALRVAFPDAAAETAPAPAEAPAAAAAADEDSLPF